MKYAPHILLTLGVFYIANTPGVLFWIGFFLLAFFLYWIVFPEERPKEVFHKLITSLKA